MINVVKYLLQRFINQHSIENSSIFQSRVGMNTLILLQRTKIFLFTIACN